MRSLVLNELREGGIGGERRKREKERKRERERERGGEEREWEREGDNDNNYYKPIMLTRAIYKDCTDQTYKYMCRQEERVQPYRNSQEYTISTRKELHTETQTESRHTHTHTYNMIMIQCSDRDCK